MMPAAHFLLYGPVPDKPQTGTGLRPESWGPLAQRILMMNYVRTRRPRARSRELELNGSSNTRNKGVPGALGLLQMMVMPVLPPTRAPIPFKADVQEVSFKFMHHPLLSSPSYLTSPEQLCPSFQTCREWTDLCVWGRGQGAHLSCS